MNVYWYIYIYIIFLLLKKKWNIQYNNIVAEQDYQNREVTYLRNSSVS